MRYLPPVDVCRTMLGQAERSRPRARPRSCRRPAG